MGLLRILCSSVFASALILLLVGCGANSTTNTTTPNSSDTGLTASPQTNGAGTSPQTEGAGTTPQTEGTAPESPQSAGNGGVSVPLAGLPIGDGSQVGDNQGNNECVNIAYLGEITHAGAVLTVTGVGFALTDPFTMVDPAAAGCPQDQPSCVGSKFTMADNNAGKNCYAGIQYTGSSTGADGTLHLDGSLSCQNADSATCEKYLQTGQGTPSTGISFTATPTDGGSAPSDSSSLQLLDLIRMADDGPSGSQLGQWISTGASIVAPVTLLSALLFYFGYVSSSSEYAYFGVDVDTIGLSTQGYIMRSPQTLLVPLLVFPLATAGFLTLNAAIRRRIASRVAHTADEANTAKPDGDPGRHTEHIRHRVQWSRLFGLAVLTIGVILLFTYPYLHGWAWYGLVTPLLIALGAGIMAYASRVLAYLQRLQEQRAPGTAKDVGPNQVHLAHEDGSVVARRIASALVYVVIAASIFWATATIAQASGRAIAQNAAKHFDDLPSVILDTKERLFLHDPGIEETVLPPSGGQTFHYRYRGLRLLIEGQDRMFLVPDRWSASDSTLIVPLDSSVRVQFQFQNQPP